MRILLISQLFDPEIAIKGLSFAKELTQRGHQIEVVTTYPNYPGGKIYPGYRMHVYQAEEIEGIRVVRLPMYMSHDRMAVKRLFGYATFSFTSFLYSLFFARRYEVIYSYLPPVAGGCTAALLGMIRRVPFIYDVQDLWPEAVVATGMIRNKRVIATVERLVNWVCRRAAAIVVLSDGYRKALVAKGIPSHKITRIYNWSDETRMPAVKSQKVEGDSHFDILYAGNMGPAQALDKVLEAAALLKSSGNSRVRFIFLGAGVSKPELELLAESKGLDNVVFQGLVTPEALGEKLAKAGALLVHLADDPVFAITIPSKTQTSLAAGRPILMAVRGESSAIVREARAGVVVEPCNPVDIARGALELANSEPEVLMEYGRAARDFYQSRMSQAIGIDEVSRVINAAVPASSGRRG